MSSSPAATGWSTNFETPPAMNRRSLSTTSAAPPTTMQSSGFRAVRLTMASARDATGASSQEPKRKWNPAP